MINYMHTLRTLGMARWWENLCGMYCSLIRFNNKYYIEKANCFFFNIGNRRYTPTLSKYHILSHVLFLSRWLRNNFMSDIACAKLLFNFKVIWWVSGRGNQENKSRSSRTYSTQHRAYCWQEKCIFNG